MNSLNATSIACLPTLGEGPLLSGSSIFLPLSLSQYGRFFLTRIEGLRTEAVVSLYTL